MNDPISRQAAIEHLKKRLYETALNNDTEHPYYEEMADNRVSVWLDEVPTIIPDTDPITQKALEAGKRGEEVRFYIGGRKFAVRELAQ